jgi:hypothetical protein
MKKLLYVNGCSHSCGAEISYPDSHRTPDDLKGSWGGQLASRFNLIHYNDAIAGQDNHSIMSSTIHSVLNLLDQYNANEILVIIGWTGFERDHFIYQDKKYRFVPGCQDRPFFKQWPDVVQNAFHNYILGIDLKSNTNNKFSLIYYSLVNFLKLHNVDYYFFNALHAVQYPAKNLLHETSNDNPTIKIFDQIQSDSNYLEPLNWDLTYYAYMKSRFDGHIDGRNHHFLASDQTTWANILADKIQYKI